ncbi:MAG: uncharacterized protein QG635_528 [Bacteroidota bacterium]|nr:uncharacterized protein [Bacteroidota bacterium]
MADKETAIAIAKKIIQECIDSGIIIDKAYLFGSFAKGIHRQYSDIDVALVSKLFGFNFLDNIRLTSNINIKYPDVELHHFNTVYFEKGDPFIEDIKNSGLIIY